MPALGNVEDAGTEAGRHCSVVVEGTTAVLVVLPGQTAAVRNDGEGFLAYCKRAVGPG